MQHHVLPHYTGYQSGNVLTTKSVFLPISSCITKGPMYLQELLQYIPTDKRLRSANDPLLLLIPNTKHKIFLQPDHSASQHPLYGTNCHTILGHLRLFLSLSKHSRPIFIGKPSIHLPHNHSLLTAKYYSSSNNNSTKTMSMVHYFNFAYC